MQWPQQGVYFFFEPGEMRPDGTTPRVVRVGTHAVSKGSKTTLWKRLSQHRGTAKSGAGNHRGSIFRLHVGNALLQRGDIEQSVGRTWGQGSSADREVKEHEMPAERAVTDRIGQMPLLWVRAEDDAGTSSVRATIERNSIALLSMMGSGGSTADAPSAGWLGRYCPNDAVRKSGLWNVNHVHDGFDPAYLDLLEELARATVQDRASA